MEYSVEWDLYYLECLGFVVERVYHNGVPALRLEHKSRPNQQAFITNALEMWSLLEGYDLVWNRKGGDV